MIESSNRKCALSISPAFTASRTVLNSRPIRHKPIYLRTMFSTWADSQVELHDRRQRRGYTSCRERDAEVGHRVEFVKRSESRDWFFQFERRRGEHNFTLTICACRSHQRFESGFSDPAFFSTRWTDRRPCIFFHTLNRQMFTRWIILLFNLHFVRL